MKSLSNTIYSRFREDGFVEIDGVLDPATVSTLRERFGLVFGEHYETGLLPDKVKWRRDISPEGIPRTVCNAWKSDRTIAQVVLSPHIGKIASKLMGWPGARVNQDTITWVPPGAGGVAFHQDNSYQDWHQPDGIITCWIVLSETGKNGSNIEYAVGSHKWPLDQRVPQFLVPEEYKSELRKAAKRHDQVANVTEVALLSGSAAFHHGKTWHGTGVNRSSCDRYSLSVHLMSSDSTFHSQNLSPMFNRYKLSGTLAMEETFFPITWTETGAKSNFIDSYVR